MSGAGGEKTFDRTMHFVIRERSVESSRQLTRAGAGGSIALVAGMMGWSALGPTIAAILIGAGLILMRVGFSRGPALVHETVTRPARVRISAEGVAIEDEPFIPRASIAQAYHQPRRTGLGTVRARDAKGNVLFDLEVKNEAERNELLRALGTDVEHGRASFIVSSPLLATTGLRILHTFIIAALGLFAIWMQSGHHKTPLYACLAALAVVIYGVAAKQQVEVGFDGFYVRSQFRSRLVRYDVIRNIEATGQYVKVTLTDGSRISLAAGGGVEGPREAELARDALAARIEAGRASFEARTRAGDFAARVGRGTRPVAEWRAALARLHDEASGYRDPAARGEDLWRVVEDAGAPEDARAGAAIALRKEEGAAARLRIAADAIASPQLRVALEKASDPEADDAALDDALEAVTRAESR